MFGFLVSITTISGSGVSVGRGMVWGSMAVGGGMVDGGGVVAGAVVGGGGGRQEDGGNGDERLE